MGCIQHNVFSFVSILAEKFSVSVEEGSASGWYDEKNIKRQIIQLLASVASRQRRNQGNVMSGRERGDNISVRNSFQRGGRDIFILSKESVSRGTQVKVTESTLNTIFDGNTVLLYNVGSIYF